MRHLRPAIMLTLLLMLLTGLAYPGLITGLGQLLFRHRANGSLVTVN
ncbi:MAG: potassium-transporting ATPase subunit C, partial [Solimonas sp.]